MFASRLPVAFRQPSLADALGDGMRLQAFRTYFGHGSAEAAAKRSGRQGSNVSAELDNCSATGSCTASSQPHDASGNDLYHQELPFTFACTADTICLWDTVLQRSDAAHHWKIMRTAFGPALWRSP